MNKSQQNEILTALDNLQHSMNRNLQGLEVLGQSMQRMQETVLKFNSINERPQS